MTLLSELDDLAATLGRATRIGAGEVRHAVLHGSRSEAKADSSTVTEADRQAEHDMTAFLREHGLKVPIIGEEDFSGRAPSDIPGIIDPTQATIYVDPGDGTSGIADGAATPFSGAYYYDPVTGGFAAAATDMIGRTFQGSGILTPKGVDIKRSWASWQEYNLESGETTGSVQPLLLPGAVQSLTPEGEELPKGAAKPNALIEISHGYNRRHALSGMVRPVLTTNQALWLQRMLQNAYVLRTSMRDSNIGHGCTVALGRQAAFTVMTAIGGPWDFCGVLIALAADATVVLFRRNARGTLEVIDFNPKNWLYEADMVLVAATPLIARQAMPHVLAAASMHG